MLEAADGEDEDLAVAHAASVSDLLNLFDDLCDAGVIDPGFELDLGEKGEGVFRFGVFAEVVFLPAVAADFADGEGFERGAAKGLDELFRKERLDDRDDLFQGRG